MTIFKRQTWGYWLIGVLFGVCLPIILKAISISPLWHNGIIFGVFYVIIAGIIGYTLKRNQGGWWLMLLLPVFFTIGTWFAGPKYAIYFTVVYLCVSYLTYGLSSTRVTE